MSLSSGIDQNNNDADLRGKFYPELIPWTADPRGDMTLGAVLVNGNSAFIPNTTTKQDATDFDTLGCVKIETGTVGQGNQLALVIGEPGDNLQIKGGTNLGSLLVGNGANTEELVCPTTTTTATTGTIYNWLSLANGQSRSFLVSDGTLYQLGYSITIVYSGTDSITGTITLVSGNLITITIVSFTSQAYATTTLITTTSPDPTTATSGGGDPVFIFNPAVCTPATIPNNSFLLTGLCYLYGAPPVVGSSNITLTAQASPPAINGTTSIFSIPQYENPPVSTSAFSWGADGCFVPDGSTVSLASDTGGAQIAFAFPTGGSFIDQNFTGSVSGYSLAYTPNGVITINSKLVLTADNTKPLGVFWGVDAQGVGTITSVSAGTNITVSGSLSAPVVNLATPTTSNIQLGVGTELLATAGFTTMSIDSTGLNDTYLNGLVENKEDIAVSATNVIQTISATDGSTYQNSAIVSCGTSTISDQKSATNLTTTEVGSAGITCGSTLVSMGLGCGFPSGANGSVSFQATNTNPTISLSQSAPFSASYSTTIDKDGIIQNNSGGVGFNIQTNSSDFNIYNTANVGIFPNNNTTIASVGTTFLNGNLIKCVKAQPGGQANPQLMLENQNATGSVALEVYKNKPTASIGGDVLFNQSVYGKDGANNKQEYTRITHAVRDNTSGSEDGSIEMSCFNAGSISTFLQLNGIENEVNCLKNLDMTGKNIITNTGDMTISTTASTGTGLLTLNAKADVSISGTSCAVLSVSGANTGALYTNPGIVEIEATNTLQFTGAGLQSATSGGNSGQHLVITLNGNVYKIALQNP